jgi:hypothetical protein
MWLAFALTVSSVPLILYLLGRGDEAKVRREWELLLTPEGERAYRSIAARVQSEMRLADMTYDEAFRVRELGSVDEAKQLLDVGYRVIAQFSPNLLKLLAAMATFSRMVSAMAPIAPLRPQGFRLAQIASLAFWDHLLHRWLVTTGQRYRLRLYILGRSFEVAIRLLLDSTRRIEASNADRDWDEIRSVRQDFQTLTDESLASLRALLDALARRQSQQALWQLAERREQWKEAPETPNLLLWGALIVAAALAFSKLLE